MKILVVDDDFRVAKLLRTAMKKWGHIAEISSRGEDALTMIKEGAFDLALVDIFLPDCMGYMIFPQIKQLAPDIKIIAMSGNDNEELLVTLNEQGVNQFMAKPFDLDVLKRRLEELVEDHKDDTDKHHQ